MMFCMLNMRVISLVFGILLALVGVVGFVATGCLHPTALIPAYLGVVLVVCGALGLKASEKARKHIMHVAVLVALLVESLFGFPLEAPYTALVAALLLGHLACRRDAVLSDVARRRGDDPALGRGAQFLARYRADGGEAVSL